MKIIILQPHIPHYRNDFFEILSEKIAIKVYCYQNKEKLNEIGFKESNFESYNINCYKIGPFIWYNPIKLIEKNSSHIVLMLDFKHVSTWFLLLTRFFHKKKIILWGQGISIKRYLKDENKSLKIIKWMLQLADGVWFYTQKELEMWKTRIPSLNAVALNNTISDLEIILKIEDEPLFKKLITKKKYNISQPIILIFCARFTPDRRIDLLFDVIERADPQRFGFVIIGEGPSKPSFKNFSNVYDFGRVYDFAIKRELFSISDIYFQPAWLGLSIVEAMGYGKPVFSFSRSKNIFQCVEYFYIKHDFNGKLFKNSSDMIKCLNEVSNDDISRLGQNAKNFVKNNLQMNNMVNSAASLL